MEFKYVPYYNNSEVHIIMKEGEFMLFKVLKRAIERGNYNTKEEMSEKISILFTAGQITEEQFNELIEMLEI